MRVTVQLYITTLRSTKITSKNPEVKPLYEKGTNIRPKEDIARKIKLQNSAPFFVSTFAHSEAKPLDTETTKGNTNKRHSMSIKCLCP